jgi:hypothetical protein
MPATRLNRGLLILGIVAIPSAFINAYVSGAFFVLFTCFDACLNVGNAIGQGQFTDLTALILPLFALAPALLFIVLCWIWELVELRRWHASQTMRMVWLFPVLTLVVLVSVTLLTSLTSSGALVVTGLNVWYGTLALALWPALIALVAGFWKGPTPNPLVAA